MTDTPIRTPGLRLLPGRGRRRRAGPAPIVPANSIAGNALMTVVAIMSFLACLTLGAVTLVRDASRDWQVDILREVTIQIRPIEGVDTSTEAAKAAAIARQFPGVSSVLALDDEENEVVLCTAFDLETIDVPRGVATLDTFTKVAEFWIEHLAGIDEEEAAPDENASEVPPSNMLKI